MATTAPSVDERLAQFFSSEPEHLENPYPILDEMRERGPVHEYRGNLLVTRYDDVRFLLRDGIFSSTSQTSSRTLRARSELTSDQQRDFDSVIEYDRLRMVSTDSPQHDRLRRIVHRAFTPKQIASLEPAIQRYTDQLLDEMATAETSDLAGFAYTLPLMVVMDLLGIPQSDRDLIRDWTTRIYRNKHVMTLLGRVDPELLTDAANSVASLTSYILDLVDEHRQGRSSGNIASTLIDAEDDERLTTQELVSTVGVVVSAGHETTTALIGVGTFELLRHREQWELLCRNPELASGATEELLRYAPPAQRMSRVAVEDCEVGGVAIRAGDSLLALISSANRDPNAFRDPGRLDIMRADVTRNVSLGLGPHYCLGAALARLEGRVVFEALARRFPEMELDGERRWAGMAASRKLERLPVRLGPDYARSGRNTPEIYHN